ncbi:MAG: NAD(P)-dependent oxidoreductase, partial [Mycobacterium sp.]|uniref:NAD(P)-dependent oxidoreductase n=1 Tax=Mycobacterium sp. TaxID=1785 RepID=UPI003BAEC348
MSSPENPYLVGLRLTGKKVVVVGGGNVAQRRLPLLIASGADVHVITPTATPAVEA